MDQDTVATLTALYIAFGGERITVMLVRLKPSTLVSPSCMLHKQHGFVNA